jgi:enoyl-CoA hydratase/carnithine racemase
MGYEDIILEKSNGVAKLIFNRPQVRNAMSERMMHEILVALKEVADDTVRVLVMTGAGHSAFSPGKDVKEVSQRPPGFYAPPPPMGEAIEALGKPVIAAVNGYCGTGALAIVLACDLVIASDNAVFVDLHASIGLVHAGGVSQKLPRLIGMKKAKEMLFLCEKMSAQEAERCGLINKVVPQDKLDETVQAVCDRLIQNSALSLAVIKGMLNKGMEMDLASGLKYEAQEYRRFRESTAAAAETKARLGKALNKDKK